MVTSIMFRGGGETTGSISDNRINSAKQETTGGVGIRQNSDSVFTADNTLKQDTVCFRGSDEQKKETSTTAVVLGTLGTVAAVVGLLGLAHKYNLASKISDGKFKEYADVVTEPCHRFCKYIKNNSYDKIVKYFANKK